MDVDSGMGMEGDDLEEEAEDEELDPQYQMHLDENEVGTGKPRKKRTAMVRITLIPPHIIYSLAPQEHPLRKWLGERDNYLLELLRRDGRGDSRSPCHQCSHADGVVRCIDCHGGRMLCRKCMVSSHHTNPLHRVEVCNHLFAFNTFR